MARANVQKANQLVESLGRARIPPETESAQSQTRWSRDLDSLANAYLAVVAICHQTTPLAERSLQGLVDGRPLRGWDYLKERFLQAATHDASLTEPDTWRSFNPTRLAQLYSDTSHGLTLGRVTERAYLLNNLGEYLATLGADRIHDVFTRCNSQLHGTPGFLEVLSRSDAFSDPLRKKSCFFVSIAASECGWQPTDSDRLLSPIDYHELRGHLRIGTIVVEDTALTRKLELGLPITAMEDVLLRRAAQDANNWIAKELPITNSRLHYLLWNAFRSCCPRSSNETHCSRCPETCSLPPQYKQMDTYHGECLFRRVCDSARAPTKLVDPAYLGHYY